MELVEIDGRRGVVREQIHFLHARRLQPHVRDELKKGQVNSRTTSKFTCLKMSLYSEHNSGYLELPLKQMRHENRFENSLNCFIRKI